MAVEEGMAEEGAMEEGGGAMEEEGEEAMVEGEEAMVVPGGLEEEGGTSRGPRGSPPPGWDSPQAWMARG